jgi:hypothetical protein
VLQRSTRSALPPRARRLLWLLAALNVMAASWMLTAGDWLDHRSRVSAVVTLGGHHLVVLWLALLAFAIIAVVATLSGGFAAINRGQLVALSIAGVASVGSLAGIVSVAGLVVGLVLLVAIIGRAFL